MIKLIVFDWDDVFTLGSIEGYYKCYQEALKAVGVSLPPGEENERIRVKWGTGHAAQLNYLLQEHPELVAKAIEHYEELFFGETFVDCLRIVPGSQQFLTSLAQNYKLTIATGGHPDILLKRVFPKFQIPDVFAQILTIYDIDATAHAKPSPYMLNKILETQGISPSEAVMVGDAQNDVLMARNAGVTPIAVLTGHLTRVQAEELQVDCIIDNVTLLEAELDKLNK